MAEQLQERLDELLVCPICLDQIKNPKTLPCQHSFCFDPCLKDLSRRSDNQQPRVGGSITCPICRKKFRFNHLSSLPYDLTLNNLLEIQRNQPPPTASAPPWEGSTSGASTSTSGLQGRLGQHEQAPLLSRNTDNVPANSKFMFKILFGLSILSLSLHIFQFIYEPVLDIEHSKEIQSSLKELKTNLEVTMESQMNFSRQELLNITKYQNESFDPELNFTKEAMESQINFSREELLNITENQNESCKLELNLTKEAVKSQMDFLRQELLNIVKNQTQV